MNEKTLLEKIIGPGGIRTLFQPVFEISGAAPRVRFYEALTRGPVGTNAENADVLFEYVRRRHEEPLADRVCVANALREARQLPANAAVSLNVHAFTLARDRAFSNFLVDTAAANGIGSDRLIIEIVEHSPASDDRAFLRTLAELRSLRVQIALDDVGLGLSNYKMFVDVFPRFLKIDRYFVRQCQHDRIRCAVIRSIAELAREINALPIAEGVETTGELVTLIRKDLTLFQGHLLARPATASEIAEAPGQETLAHILGAFHSAASAALCA